MTGLLTAAAIFFVISLLASAAGTIGGATAADPNRRGRWGMVTRTSRRVRPLNPQERRWQTSMIAGKDTDNRWRDLVGEIEALQRQNSISPAEPAPKSYSFRWLDDAVTELEKTIDTKTIDTQTIDTQTTDTQTTRDESKEANPE